MAVPVGEFSEEMRDLQSRGRDPYLVATNLDLASGGDNSNSNNNNSGNGHGHGSGDGNNSRHNSGSGGADASAAHRRHRKELRKTESELPDGSLDDDFAIKDSRQRAAVVLDNPELLMQYAQSAGDSIPHTRMHFTRIMCGYSQQLMEAMEANVEDTPASNTAAAELSDEDEFGGRTGRRNRNQSWKVCDDADGLSSGSAGGGVDHADGAAGPSKRKLPDWT